MSELVADCPRCGAKQITFKLLSAHDTRDHEGSYLYQISRSPKDIYRAEAFCVCINCRRSTVFYLHALREPYGDHGFSGMLLDHSEESVNSIAEIRAFICIKDMCSTQPPEHVPSEIEAIFREGATCLSVECFNAAGTMFRLCVDLATKPLLPETDDKENDNENVPNNRIRRTLGLRLNWLFDNNKLPEDLHELSDCIRDDGNDGAHAGTLQKEDAGDLLDFTEALLERLYTEPKRLKLAKQRRTERRNNP